ncbi:alpha-hydroxy-acid oxidizing protein [Tardiphaga alba]|uniref:Alpha-hydroxy-acid oxidizing protein n=1 Tax=Tardiphaga alba TaxID=340268 RepID=A0ABX8A3X0_9BRAD|nr:alpha-hydroxy acid oxidase [Tardiphaga alba]QUS38349.1 alpha-hydroxy-acid oxidizing protein [Tardiphaga alba]
MKNVANIADLHRLASRRVPRAFFQYVCAGSYEEEALRANLDDFRSIKLRQRVLVDMDGRDLSTMILGAQVPLPIALAPVALTGLQHGNGEILAAQAAADAGIPYTLSTMSICSIEQVAEATGKPFWFQLYVMRDRGFVADLIGRARAANCSALVLTVDLQVLGQRHCDVRNGLSIPPEIRLGNILDMATKPAWIASVLRGKSRTFGNLAGHVKGLEDVTSLAQWTATQFDQALSWDDIAWVKSLWPGKLILKGILDIEDAKRASQSGADAIVVSNHGGRQLDGAASSISILPGIVDAVGSEIEVMFDGGIRTGTDIMRALALGAKSCLIGRPYAWGVGAAGKTGAARAIDILARELDVTLALCGYKCVVDVGREAVQAIGHSPR